LKTVEKEKELRNTHFSIIINLCTCIFLEK